MAERSVDEEYEGGEDGGGEGEVGQDGFLLLGGEIPEDGDTVGEDLYISPKRRAFVTD